MVGEEAIGVAVTFDIEANELTFVVEAINGGGANAVGIIDGCPVSIVQGAGQEETVHHAIAIEIAQAEAYLREGIEVASRLENRNRLTLLLANLGSAIDQQGEYQHVNSYFREALSMARTIGSPWYIFSFLMDWGAIHENLVAA